MKSTESKLKSIEIYHFFHFNTIQTPVPWNFHTKETQRIVYGGGGVPHTNQDPTLNDERLVGPVQQHQTLDPQRIVHRNSFTKCQSGIKSWWLTIGQKVIKYIQVNYNLKNGNINKWWSMNPGIDDKHIWDFEHHLTRCKRVMIPPQDVFLPMQNLGQFHWLIIMFPTMVAYIGLFWIPAAEKPVNILQCIPPISMFMRLFMSMLFMNLPVGIHFSPFCMCLLVSIL